MFGVANFLAFAVLAGLLGGARAEAPATVVLQPTSSIPLKGYSQIVADGRRAAAVSWCGIIQWAAGQRKGAFTKACRPLGNLDGTGADEFALAGNRLAWLREEEVSHALVVQSELVVKTGSSPPREIASAYNEYGDGSWLLGLAGGGGTLAVGWTFDTLDDQNVPVHDEAVYRISPTTVGSKTCPHAAGLLPSPPAARFCVDSGLPGGKPVAASHGWILGRYYGKLYVTDPSGATTELSVPNAAFVALSGKTIVIVRTGKQSAVETWDAESGHRLSRHALPPLHHATQLQKLTVGGAFASFWSHGLHVVSLRDGRDRIVKVPGGTPVHGALTSAGLFVLYRVKGGERLGLVPISKL